MKDREEMLKICKEKGMYIKEEFYDRKDILDCAQYVLDADDNYSEDLMYNQNNNVDYYDEDHYITYHFDFAKDFLLEELFWDIIFDNEDEDEDFGSSILGEMLDEDWGPFLNINDLIYMLDNFSNNRNKRIIFNNLKYFLDLKYNHGHFY